MKGYTNAELKQRIDNDFKYHAPKEDTAPRYDALRSVARAFALAINTLVPDSREKSLALTKLEEAVMWANAGVARNS